MIERITLTCVWIGSFLVALLLVELYIGKTLAAMIPPLLASYGGMFVYLGGLVFGYLAWRPPTMLVVQIMVLTTVQALVMVTGAVVVSSQTTSTRAANLLASFIIIPMALLIQGESVIMFLAPDAESPNGIGALWAIIVGMTVVVVMLLRVGNSIFNREELLGRAIDQLNLKSTVLNLWRNVRSVDDEGTPARSLVDWYRRGIPLSLGRLGLAFWVTLLVFVGALVAGYIVGQQPEWRLPLPQNIEITDALTNFDSFFSLPTKTGAVMFYVWQNGRVLLAATIIGMFTFGVGALVITPVVYVIIGYFFSQILLSGYDPAFMVAAILPHGMVEIPVIVLATAAAVRLGAAVTRPPMGETVGQAWSRGLGDAIKIGAGVIVPGLLLAGILEAFVTPQVVLAVLGG